MVVNKIKNKMSRAQYRMIKGMDNDKMTAYLDKIEENAYTEGYKEGFSKGAKADRPARVVETFDKDEKDNTLIRYTCPNKDCRKRFQTSLLDLPGYCRQCGCKLSWADVIEGEKELEQDPDPENEEAAEKSEQTEAAEAE